MTVSPEARVAPELSHCQIWLREISAVAASSMRLWIATAPLPSSHAWRYWMPTETLPRKPSSVRSPGVEAASSRSSPLTETSSRCLSSWLGESPRTPVKISLHSSTMPGWATHDPSNPAPTSRSLSARTLAKAASLTAGSLLGMNAAMPPIANAPRLWQVCTSRSL